MPTLGNIVINDGKATPVAHTFYPTVNRETGIKWTDRTGSSPLEFPYITWNSQWTNNGQLFRPKYALTIPIVEIRNGVTYKVADARVVAEAFLPEVASLAVRKDLHMMTRNLLALTSSEAMFNYSESYI